MEQNVWDTMLQFRKGKYQTPGFIHLERQGRCQGDPEKERSSVPTNTKKKAGKSRKIFQPDDGARRQVNRIRRRNQTLDRTDQ